MVSFSLQMIRLKIPRQNQQPQHPNNQWSTGYSGRYPKFNNSHAQDCIAYADIAVFFLRVVRGGLPEITSPNALKDLLMLMASFILSPFYLYVLQSVIWATSDQSPVSEPSIHVERNCRTDLRLGFALPF